MKLMLCFVLSFVAAILVAYSTDNYWQQLASGTVICFVGTILLRINVDERFGAVEHDGKSGPGIFTNIIIGLLAGGIIGFAYGEIHHLVMPDAGYSVLSQVFMQATLYGACTGLASFVIIWLMALCVKISAGGH